jgi:hypothetical protein
LLRRRPLNLRLSLLGRRLLVVLGLVSWSLRLRRNDGALHRCWAVKVEAVKIIRE